MVGVARAERWVWYAFLATLAWQLRIILWQADPLFWEWRSASVWLSDLLMLALFAAALWRGWRPCLPAGRRGLQGYDWLLAFFFAASVLSLGHADHLGIGLYQLGRFALFALFYLYLRQYAFKTFDAELSAGAFVTGALAQAVLGIAQFYLQHDVGIRWVGETLLRTDMRGVAVFYDLMREKTLRAYGTLPHPNILAAYLMLALFALSWLWIRHGAGEKLKIKNDKFRHLSFITNHLSLIIWSLSATLLLWGMLLTFSRTMLVAWGAGTAVMFSAIYWGRISSAWANIGLIRQRLGRAAILVAAVCALFLAVHWDVAWARMTIGAGDEAVRLRIRYAQNAVDSGESRGLHVNWTGVGIGNFTSWLQRYDSSLPRFMQQPAHNIYLLAYTETGLLGVGVWLAWLALLVRGAWRAHRGQPALKVGLMAMLGALFFIGLFDHFFWTLQQGRILWWLALAVAAGKGD